MRNAGQPTSANRAGRRRSVTHFARMRRENQRRWKRQTVYAPLVELGSRVAIPANILLKRRRSSEKLPSSTKPELKSIGSRRLEQSWLDQHGTEYAGDWVALQSDRLVARGSSARQVLDAAALEGCVQPLVVHIPSEPPLPFGGW